MVFLKRFFFFKNEFKFFENVDLPPSSKVSSVANMSTCFFLHHGAKLIKPFFVVIFGGQKA
jgi:hypothetical protein